MKETLMLILIALWWMFILLFNVVLMQSAICDSLNVKQCSFTNK